VRVDEHTIELAGSPVFYRSASGVPALYLHGVPTSADDWLELLERAGGVAPDLIGFGRSGKGGHLDYTIEGLSDAVEGLAGAIEPLRSEPLKLVGNDWGAAVALELAARHPERTTALVLCNPVPLIDGFEWPWPARVWRRPVLGELAMGSTNRWLLGGALRRGAARDGTWTAERIAALWEQFDQGTQRATLRLHRRTDLRRFDAARGTLRRVQVPALILWGEHDPWFPVALAERFAELLPNPTVERVAGAGHWPLLDRPELNERVAAFPA
jgi:pimeloyl-ACP methyl ester carboxylesterase